MEIHSQTNGEHGLCTLGSLRGQGQMLLLWLRVEDVANCHGFMCAAWLVYKCGLTHSYAGRGSVILYKCLFLICILILCFCSIQNGPIIVVGLDSLYTHSGISKVVERYSHWIMDCTRIDCRLNSWLTSPVKNGIRVVQILSTKTILWPTRIPIEWARQLLTNVFFFDLINN